MLQSPSEIAGSNSADVRRFNNLLQKEFPRQAKKYKNLQKIRMCPPGTAGWFVRLMHDKQELKHITACVNDSLDGSGWKIINTEIINNSPYGNHPTSIMVTLKHAWRRVS